MKEELLARFDDLITGVASVDHRLREGVELYKAHFLLADGSSLHVSEVWVDGRLKKYSYYWLDETEELLAGWDNAPHHPEIKTHPHHQHTREGSRLSTVRNLEDVLKLLAKQITAVE